MMSGMRLADASKRISEGHALAVLQTLHAAGVDVLAGGPEDQMPILHAAAAANAPALVRWLMAVAGASLEERGSEGYTPLQTACRDAHWDAALALLDCGAPVDNSGPIDGRALTIAEWGRDSPECAQPGCRVCSALQRPVAVSCNPACAVGAR
jgi:hypothetical protein